MNQISREECIRVYDIEIQFFNDLVSAELIETTLEGNTVYLSYENLGHFEKLVYYHYDLEINVPGLEVISHLLKRIEDLQRVKVNQ